MPLGKYPRTEKHKQISRENGKKASLISKERRLEINKKISLARMGFEPSAETKKKIGDSNRTPLEDKIKNYKGKSIGYIHKLLTLRYGKPNQCEGTYHDIHSKRLNWALKKGHEYSPDRKDYLILCQKCHYQYDIADIWSEYRKSKEKQNVT